MDQKSTGTTAAIQPKVGAPQRVARQRMYPLTR